jgi:uncharacterized membrane protein HdeD (DUF308 family)
MRAYRHTLNEGVALKSIEYITAMNASILANPSVLAHMINGFLLMLTGVLVAWNFRTLRKSNPYRLVLLVSILSIAVGIHALSHLGLESMYGLSPAKLIHA